MGRYVVLGITGDKDMRSVLHREKFKAEGEPRDVYDVDEDGARSASQYDDIYAFEVCNPRDPACLYIVTFDIGLVKAKTEMARRETRKPAKEYVAIKDHMILNLCAPVDLSTYACPENLSTDVDRMLSGFGVTRYHVRWYYARPAGEREREFLREAFQEALGTLISMALQLSSRVSNAHPKGYGRVRRKAAEFLDALSASERLATSLQRKLRALGVELDVLDTLRNAREHVIDAVRKREEGREEGFGSLPGRVPLDYHTGPRLP